MSGDSQGSSQKGRRGAETAGGIDLLPTTSSLSDRESVRRVPLDSDVVVRALRPLLAPLQAMLEREIADRRTLQGQADDLRTRLAAAQLETAEARRDADVERALSVSAQAHIKDLRAQVEALRDALTEPPPRPWWWPF